jgi:predicted outer membrane protein
MKKGRSSMSIFTRIYAGLLASTLSLTAQAAQTEPRGQTPVEEPSELTLEVTNVTEVIQVLHIGIESEKQVIELVKARNPDASLQQFIESLSQDVDEAGKKVQELAASKGVDLAPEKLTENAKKIEAAFAKEVQSLAQTSDADFRATAIKALMGRDERAIGLYNLVEQGSSDEDVKAAVVEFRPLAQKHLEAAQQLEKQTTEPSEPTPPAPA